MDQVRLKEVELYLQHTSTSEVSSLDVVYIQDIRRKMEQIWERIGLQSRA